MTKILLALVMLIAGVVSASALEQSQIPSKFNIPWGNSAGAGFIRTIPQASQIGITNCAASLTDGFPPLTFQPSTSGGCPPFGQDFNGILKQITQWSQWQGAGAFPVYDGTFSTSISGYPSGTTLANVSTPGCFWVSTVDNNTSDPDTGGANWDSYCPGGGIGGTSTGAANAQVVSATPIFTASGKAGPRVCWASGFNNTGSTTIDVNGAGAISLLKMGTAGALIALQGGELQTNQLACANWDGTEYQLDLGTAASAQLNVADQTVTGGANITTLGLGSVSSGTVTVDCGARGIQEVTNNGSFTLAAPSHDGSCLVQIQNTSTPGTITFSGFQTNGNTGDPMSATANSIFVVNVWRINSIASYLVKQIQ